MKLDSVVTILPLVPVGLGLGMLFVPTSRAALNASPLGSHGRTSALLSVGRLLGATVGAGLAGVALSGTLTASTVQPNAAAGGHVVRPRGASRRDLLDCPARPAGGAGHQRLTDGARGRAGCSADARLTRPPARSFISSLIFCTAHRGVG